MSEEKYQLKWTQIYILQGNFSVKKIDILWLKSEVNQNKFAARCHYTWQLTLILLLCFVLHIFLIFINSKL